MSDSNSDADNNVLTNFQPMPKRFMVWNKKERYSCYNHDGSHIFNIRDLAVFFVDKAIDGVPHNRFELVQSTNLFDEDGEEIFEGSVVRDFDESVGVVYYDDEDGEYRAKSSNGNSFELGGSSYDLKVIGHILSNPELLEENELFDR